MCGSWSMRLQQKFENLHVKQQTRKSSRHLSKTYKAYEHHAKPCKHLIKKAPLIAQPLLPAYVSLCGCYVFVTFCYVLLCFWYVFAMLCYVLLCSAMFLLCFSMLCYVLPWFSYIIAIFLCFSHVLQCFCYAFLWFAMFCCYVFQFFPILIFFRIFYHFLIFSFNFSYAFIFIQSLPMFYVSFIFPTVVHGLVPAKWLRLYFLSCSRLGFTCCWAV